LIRGEQASIAQTQVGVAMEQPSTSTGTVLAGFIVWLAQRGIEPGKRRRCPAIIEQFLR
jgi:hypothetical protein